MPSYSSICLCLAVHAIRKRSSLQLDWRLYPTWRQIIARNACKYARLTSIRTPYPVYLLAPPITSAA